MARYGSFFLADCEDFKGITQYVASRAAGRAWEENHTEELTLSLAEPVSRLTEKDRKTIMESRNLKEMMEIIENAGFSLK